MEYDPRLADPSLLAQHTKASLLRAFRSRLVSMQEFQVNAANRKACGQLNLKDPVQVYWVYYAGFVISESGPVPSEGAVKAANLCRRMKNAPGITSFPDGPVTIQPDPGKLIEWTCKFKDKDWVTTDRALRAAPWLKPLQGVFNDLQITVHYKRSDKEVLLNPATGAYGRMPFEASVVSGPGTVGSPPTAWGSLVNSTTNSYSSEYQRFSWRIATDRQDLNIHAELILDIPFSSEMNVHVGPLTMPAQLGVSSQPTNRRPIDSRGMANKHGLGLTGTCVGLPKT